MKREKSFLDNGTSDNFLTSVLVNGTLNKIKNWSRQIFIIYWTESGIYMITQLIDFKHQKVVWLLLVLFFFYAEMISMLQHYLEQFGWTPLSLAVNMGNIEKSPIWNRKSFLQTFYHLILDIITIDNYYCYQLSLVSFLVTQPNLF